MCHSAKRIPVIRTEVTYGKGTEEDPARIVKEYWDDDGHLLWRDDPLKTLLEEKAALEAADRMAEYKEGKV